MMNVCTACRRHVRESECPFCGSAANAPHAGTPLRTDRIRGTTIVATALIAATMAAPAAADASALHVLPGQAVVTAYGVPPSLPPQQAPTPPPPAVTPHHPSSPAPGPSHSRRHSHRPTPARHAQPAPAPRPPVVDPGSVAAYGIPPGER